MTSNARIHLEVRGIVQGVGFRPFIHRLTEEFSLSGWVRNTTFGAELELEGPPASLDRFCEALQERKPPLAVLDRVLRTDGLAPEGSTVFQILTSAHLSGYDALVSPDVAICPDCLRELKTPSDRRYLYPFINCTNCGPRFTIVRDIPYDRGNTSMARFPMCSPCAEEYGDLRDRRYHAQPNCCGECGPRLQYLDAAGAPCPGDPLTLAQALLRRGGILAVKGLGGFHLACLAEDPAAVETLRARKLREEKPFAVMCASVEAARRICRISPAEETVLTSHQAPIVLLEKRDTAPSGLSENRSIGLMLPYTPLHQLLMEPFDLLVMTSANRSDCPVAIGNQEALTELHGIADGFLVHDREIVTRCDDSLVRVFRDQVYFLRRSRGYAPAPVNVSAPVSGILACGAEQKASFCLGKEHHAFLSQHIGDLKNAETLAHYEHQIAHFQRLFGISPRALVCDAHPDYLSTRYAQDRAKRENLPLLTVQHHHAHMVSCMADNELDTPCIGVIWDGTGYGADGTVWGGEWLCGDASGYQRLASIRPIRLPGGDLCTREIDRVAHSLLWDAGFADRTPLSEARARLLTRQLEAGLNCPAASSMGRLFDGVYALLSGRCTVTYEGQGAVLLEAMATQGHRIYPCPLNEERGVSFWDTRSLVRELCRDLDDGVDAGAAAAAFLDTLVSVARSQCALIRTQTGLSQVVLSGGVFQNMYLLPRILDALREDGFRTYCHHRVSCNDEGISLGQLMIAAKEDL